MFAIGIIGYSGVGAGVRARASQALQRAAATWWKVLYAGVLLIGLGFTLWVVGQRRAPATSAAVILSMEAVFAALFGWLLLSETLAARQMLNCGLMPAGMLLAQLGTFARETASLSIPGIAASG